MIFLILFKANNTFYTYQDESFVEVAEDYQQYGLTDEEVLEIDWEGFEKQFEVSIASEDFEEEDEIDIDLEVIKKDAILFEVDSNIYTYDNGWVDTGLTEPVSDLDIYRYGIVDEELESIANWREIGSNFNVIAGSLHSEDPLDMVIEARWHNYVLIKQGNEIYTYQDNEFVKTNLSAPISAEEFFTKGVWFDQFNDIPTEKWEDFYSTRDYEDTSIVFSSSAEWVNDNQISEINLNVEAEILYDSYILFKYNNSIYSYDNGFFDTGLVETSGSGFEQHGLNDEQVYDIPKEDWDSFDGEFEVLIASQIFESEDEIDIDIEVVLPTFLYEYSFSSKEYPNVSNITVGSGS